ncbi:MAG: UDP-2,3-diacylglucosamine diphosphatase [Gammaproteobacteria bacterium]|jgi:UDP-2,3-diacylglucosamine hydrolase|nr:UDP-2,3-diacylglucosamine diphosphatase [Gammaproteobacteria bacterium]MBT4449518.1 UDP-2,3-diacylglucosamine diphosphatase [Gammaproteobacteria bacterium]MBT6457246.1 UDP-2,3-diacylglucosamine diphosphatase [Gammaproteobacteria bacterium]MBT7046955.1 UDP-2,3-diacylglucosamine diphosphatase [Gammaproteobacteria bacterium]
MKNEILFISDLHLDRYKPDISLHFLNFIKTRASTARVLYILGDLFETWSGDDDPAIEFSEIFNALQKLAKSIEIYFLHGNRDFLVGEQLTKKLGITIIKSPHIINLGTHKVALLHGDELCTDDTDYQQFRKMVREKEWQHDFLAKPLSERLQITAQLRQQSKSEMGEKTTAIMDVNPLAVLQTFNQLNVDTLIHGHTHRPGIHSLEENRQRIVLGDWNPEPSYLSWLDEKLKLNDPRV